MQRLIAALCLCLLATAAQAAPPNQRPGAKSVCVASMLGHRYDIQTIGLMVFGNDLQSPSVESWGIDDLVVHKVGAILGKNYAVRRMTLSDPALLAADNPGGLLFRQNNTVLTDALRSAAGRNGPCDFYLTVMRSSGAISGTNQGIYGLGILKRDGIIVRRFVFVMINLRLYDRSFAQLKQTTPRTDDPVIASLFGNGIVGVYREVDSTMWPVTPQAAVQSAALREMTRALVEQALTKSVPELF